MLYIPGVPTLLRTWGYRDCLWYVFKISFVYCKTSKNSNTPKGESDSDPSDCYQQCHPYPSGLFTMPVPRCEKWIHRNLKHGIILSVLSTSRLLLFYIDIIGIFSCQCTNVFLLYLTTGIPQFECTMIYLLNPLLIHIGSSVSLLPVPNTFIFILV